MTLPINVIFSHLQVRAWQEDVCWWKHACVTALRFATCFSFSCCVQKKPRVRLWLYEDARMQIEGQIIGFDEYMK